ncbi:hypothetical protein H2203_008049 [Taxawa tesnikishii (nom. ined.)]|nr:hypothetical protein H2203_008049 [Dothideales sp. JES 119]
MSPGGVELSQPSFKYTPVPTKFSLEDASSPTATSPSDVGDVEIFRPLKEGKLLATALPPYKDASDPKYSVRKEYVVAQFHPWDYERWKKEDKATFERERKASQPQRAPQQPMTGEIQQKGKARVEVPPEYEEFEARRQELDTAYGSDAVDKVLKELHCDPSPAQKKHRSTKSSSSSHGTYNHIHSLRVNSHQCLNLSRRVNHFAILQIR